MRHSAMATAPAQRSGDGALRRVRDGRVVRAGPIPRVRPRARAEGAPEVRPSLRPVEAGSSELAALLLKSMPSHWDYEQISPRFVIDPSIRTLGPPVAMPSLLLASVRVDIRIQFGYKLDNSNAPNSIRREAVRQSRPPSAGPRDNEASRRNGAPASG